MGSLFEDYLSVSIFSHFTAERRWLYRFCRQAKELLRDLNQEVAVVEIDRVPGGQTVSWFSCPYVLVVLVIGYSTVSAGAQCYHWSKNRWDNGWNMCVLLGLRFGIYYSLRWFSTIYSCSLSTASIVLHVLLHYICRHATSTVFIIRMHGVLMNQDQPLRY